MLEEATSLSQTPWDPAPYFSTHIVPMGSTVLSHHATACHATPFPPYTLYSVELEGSIFCVLEDYCRVIELNSNKFNIVESNSHSIFVSK